MNNFDSMTNNSFEKRMQLTQEERIAEVRDRVKLMSGAAQMMETIDREVSTIAQRVDRIMESACVMVDCWAWGRDCDCENDEDVIERMGLRFNFVPPIEEQAWDENDQPFTVWRSLYREFRVGQWWSTEAKSNHLSARHFPEDGDYPMDLLPIYDANELNEEEELEGNWSAETWDRPVQVQPGGMDMDDSTNFGLQA